MKRFINGVGRVIIGGYNFIFHKNIQQSRERFQICMECDDKIKLGRGYICSHCGCELHAKTASPDEHCSLKKW